MKKFDTVPPATKDTPILAIQKYMAIIGFLITNDAARKAANGNAIDL